MRIVRTQQQPAGVTGMTPKDLVDGVKPADPAKYYKEVVIPADMNLTF